MIEYRKASDRFESRIDWLDSRHSFSFGHHYDPSNLGFGPLRVVNEDWIDARSGFPTHSHREMEILTYVIAGTLSHRDSEGSDDAVRPGRLQLMHAGTGIAHSEINHGDETVHLLQIWIEPDRKGTAPAYEMLDYALSPGVPTVLASSDAEAGGLPLRQDATVSALQLEAQQSFTWPLSANRRGWIQVVSGAGEVSSLPFEAGDAFAIDETEGLELKASRDAEFVLFELPQNDTRA